MGKDRLGLEVFDMLDTTLCGFITAEQVHTYYESANVTQIPLYVVISALHHVCGFDVEECRRDQFSMLLAEIRRRQQVRDQIFWDFKALDIRNQGRVSLKNALFLFKATFQEDFSLKMWDVFLSNRIDQNADVSLVELEAAVLDPPVYGQPSSMEDLYSKEAELDAQTLKRDFTEYSMLMGLQRDVDAEEEKMREWKRSTVRESRRKVKQIEKYGLDGILMTRSQMIIDDFDTEDTPEKQKERDLNNIEVRYDNAKGRLLWEMLRLKVGEVEWAAMSAEEKQARLTKLRANEKKMLRDGCIDQIGCLLGDPVSFVVDMNSLLGPDQKQYDVIMKEKISQRRRKLAAGQRLDPEEREQKSDDIFIALQLRYDQEKAAVISRYLQQRGDPDKVNELTIKEALERKYSTLEDKLFASALQEGMGEVEWDIMTSEQKEAKKVKLRLQLNHERNSGKDNELLNPIVGDKCSKQSRIDLLFGDVEGHEDMQFPKECSVRKTFVDLQKRKELEWQQLETDFKQQTAQKDRQLQLMCLLLAREFACCETSFHRAVIVAGLCEQLGSSDRSAWHDELAADRERARRTGNDVLHVAADSGLMVDNSGLLSIQERIIKELIRKHVEEVAVLFRMAADPTVQQMTRNLKKVEPKERQQRKVRILNERLTWRLEGTTSSHVLGTNQMQSLEATLSLRSVVIYSKLAEQQDSAFDPITHSSVITSILIELQSRHLEEAHEILQAMLGKGRTQLFRLLETEKQLCSGGYYDNLARVLLHTEGTELEAADEVETEESGDSEGEEAGIVELTKEDELKMMQELESKFLKEKAQLLHVLIDKDRWTRLSPERPMSASLQKRISEFKMRRMTEEPSTLSDTEMSSRHRERVESAKKQTSMRMKLLQRRKREEKQNRVVDSDKSSDSEDSSKAAKHSSLIDDIPSGTQLMLDNQEAKSKMKELERLFELKRQALVEGIQKHEQKAREVKKSGNSTSSLEKDGSLPQSLSRSKLRRKQRTLTQLQNEAELLAHRAFVQETLLDKDKAIPENTELQTQTIVSRTSSTSVVPTVHVTGAVELLDPAQQQEIAGSLVTQATTHDKSVEEEKLRQKEIVKNRLQHLKNRRKSELTLVLDAGQRQKEQLEKKMKERVKYIRFPSVSICVFVFLYRKRKTDN
ncbi:trichohyalin-like isoform X2 [Corticium candelabrum]|uniref:trichohyalin-like isoform X2 n=1 Tax=Corticium candelabrum TaxID=121492 RepID=UPI002E26E4E6|nr:trichohyalin-like isoform X2 [Corticium candelabrum]